jgi:uncharacterized protein (DUF433 family)
MAQPRPWVDEIQDALRELGGKAHLEEIYRRVQERGKMDFSANAHWQDRIRGTIETHSSDSIAYTGQRDLFCSVDGIGSGVWGLRNQVQQLEGAQQTGRGEVAPTEKRHDLNVLDRITIEPGKRAGKPCIRGMRITVYDILEYLASGMTQEQILGDFPELTADDIRACLAFAAERERRLVSIPA